MKVDEIIPGLYIRGHFRHISRDKKIQALEDYDIGLVVCTCRKSDSDFPILGIMYEVLPVPDGKEIAKEKFQYLEHLIVGAYKSGVHVLVNCAAGRNRSGLACGLAVRRILGCTGLEAYERVKAARANTFANEYFKDYLCSMEAPNDDL